MHENFRAGLSSDFYTDAPASFERVVAEQFDGKVEFSPLPPQPARTATPEALNQYDALVSLALRITAGSLEGVNRLAVVARWGVGYDMIDVDAMTRAGVALCITPNGVRRPVAEAVLTFVFALAKNLFHLDRVARSGKWRGGLPLALDLHGKVLGAVGCGNIGKELFRIARGLGFSRFLSTDPAVSQDQVNELGVELVDLDTLFRESDFVSVNCLLNEQTRNLVDERHLRLMKPSAYLINTARGPIVNHAALIKALEEHWIAGAGIDVYPQEPPPANDPLFKLDNVIVSPHALAWTEHIVRDTGREACGHVLSVLRGEVPANIVNREVLNHKGFLEKLERYK